MNVGEIVDGFSKLATDFGLFVALAVSIIAVLSYGVVWLIRKIIKIKDEEIERLVKERNKLQNMILKKRKSSKK